MHLNHPETIPSIPVSMEKLFSTKAIPGPRKTGDRSLTWKEVEEELCVLHGLVDFLN